MSKGKPKTPPTDALGAQAANFAQAAGLATDDGAEARPDGAENRTGGARTTASKGSEGRQPGPQRDLDPDPDGDRTGRTAGDPLAR